MGSWSTRAVVLLGGGLQEVPGGVAVSDGGGLGEAEHDSQVERVGPVGECFVELAVDAQGFERGGCAAEGRGERVLADRPGRRRRLLVDDQVRVGGVGPAAASVGEPLQHEAMGELVQRACHAGDGEPPIAQVEVIELQRADGLRAGGVHTGQGQGEPGGGCGRGPGDVLDLLGGQRKDRRVIETAGPDPRGRVGEDGADLLAVPHNDRSAIRVCRRGWPRRAAVTAAMSPVVTSRR